VGFWLGGLRQPEISACGRRRTPGRFGPLGAGSRTAVGSRRLIASRPRRTRRGKTDQGGTSRVGPRETHPRLGGEKLRPPSEQRGQEGARRKQSSRENLTLVIRLNNVPALTAVFHAGCSSIWQTNLSRFSGSTPFLGSSARFILESSRGSSPMFRHHPPLAERVESGPAYTATPGEGSRKATPTEIGAFGWENWPRSNLWSNLGAADKHPQYSKRGPLANSLPGRLFNYAARFTGAPTTP